MFLRHQLLTLLNADIAVFTQSELAVATRVQIRHQCLQNRASAVFIPDARIDWLLVGRNIVRVVCPCFSLGQRYDPEQIAANSCVLAEGDVRMVKIIHIVKSDASGTIGADQLGRLGFAPLKAGVCIRGAQVGQDAVICVAEQQIIRNWFLQFRDLKCAPTNAFGMKLPFPLLALPAGIGLSVLATPIEKLVLPSQQELAVAAGPHLQILGIATIFICLMVLTNAILQTYGKEKLPIFTVIAGGVVKVVMNYILVGNPDISIHGAPISTLCCYLTICGLNLFFVWKYSPEKPRYTRLFGKPIVASAVMGAAVWAVYGLVARVLSGHSAYGANALATFCGILAGVVVYGVLVITLRILQAEDVKALPKGEKIAKLLRLK